VAVDQPVKAALVAVQHQDFTHQLAAGLLALTIFLFGLMLKYPGPVSH
jgi:hypothetical protein